MDDLKEILLAMNITPQDREYELTIFQIISRNKMVDLKVDNVVFCCDLGRCPQNNVGVSSSCDITNNLFLFSDGPVRERTFRGIGIASDRGDVI